MSGLEKGRAWLRQGQAPHGENASLNRPCVPSRRRTLSYWVENENFFLLLGRFRVWSADRYTTGPDASAWKAETMTTRLICWDEKHRGPLAASLLQ